MGSNDIRLIQRELRNLRDDLGDLQTNSDDKFEAICEKVDELELRMDELYSEIHATKTGKLIWKVSNILEALKRTQNDDEDAIYSDFIYTGTHGYKLQAILYPNGVAGGRGTHVSLYIMIRKGDYDPILTWPFRQRVTFTLLDVSSDTSVRKDYKEELIGDRKSSSFTRPTSDSNPGWGFPKFISHQDLSSGHFINDDAIFFKVEVEAYDATLNR